MTSNKLSDLLSNILHQSTDKTSIDKILTDKPSTDKPYKELKIDELFNGKITILNLIEMYKLNDSDVYKYKTSDDSYIPFYNSYTQLELNKIYEIKGYKCIDSLQIKEINEVPLISTST